MRRLGGFGIDSILYAVFLLVVLVLSGADLEAVADGDEVVSKAVLLIDLLIIGIYQVTLTAVRGQTIGKVVLRTKVVDSETGAIPGWQNSFIRWGAPAALSTVPWVGYLVIPMYAWILRDPRRQGLHDKAAQTVVISIT
jgi:uncharacterized RDD family membrane protein YckC